MANEMKINSYNKLLQATRQVNIMSIDTQYGCRVPEFYR